MEVLAASFSLLLVLLGGGFGIPLGVPPGPEDPLLAKVAPEKCLYYTTWAGMAPADANSENHSERLLADPEVRGFVTEVQARLQRMARDVAVRDPDAALFAEVFPELGIVLVTRPAAIFVEEADLRRGPAGVRAALIVNLGDARARVEPAVNKFRQQILQLQSDTVKIAGADFERTQLNPQLPPITWGIRGQYFVLGIGEGTVEGIFERAASPAPKWLTDLQDRYPLPRRATLTYTDLAGLIERTVPLAGDPAVNRLVESVGLSQLKSYASVTGLDATGFVSKTEIEIEGPARGLLSLLEGQPLAAADLAPIPDDALVAVAFRLDGQKFLDTLLQLLGQIEPRAVVEFNEGLNEIEQELNVRIRQELLASLGDVWQVYTSAQEGGLITGWTFSASVRDRARLELVQAKLLAVFGQLALQNRRAPRIRSTPVGDFTMHSLVIPDDDFLITPSWCIAGDRLFVSLFPQPIKAQLGRPQNARALVDVPVVAAALGGDPAPLCLTYTDTRAVFQTVYPLLQIGAQVMAVQLQREGIDLDMTILPSASAIGRHLQPSVTTVRRTATGIVIDVQQTLPSGSVGATAPAMIATMLPAVISARHAAQRMQGSNNLKQIALAMHNYHDTFKGFPAVYSVDENGEPLLSWRVHILPFIEQQRLYDQFHLDEPWNSEHNRRLIAQMPQVYKAPGSRSDPGKTNYLGSAAESGIFGAPRAANANQNKFPIGTRIRDITDGTSNTIAVVEASDELAVIWTKPGDFEPDAEDPIKGLVGVRRGVFMAALCDGSVRAISEAVDKTVLRALFTRNGGEPIERPF